MKAFKNRLYTHPVLREVNNDFKDIDFIIEILNKSIDLKRSMMQLQIKLSLENKELNRLIIEDKIKIYIHLESPYSLFRKTVPIKIGLNELEIDYSRINSTLELIALATVNQDIKNYHNSRFVDFFKDNSFNIESGEILAISNAFELLIPKPNEDFKNVNSVVVFVEDNKLENDGFEVTLTGEKIEIRINKMKFVSYHRLKESSTLAPLIYTAFIIPTLIYVIEQILDVSNRRDYNEKKWYKVLEKRINQVMENTDLDDSLAKPSILIAQKLIDFPIKSFFDYLENRREEWTYETDVLLREYLKHY